MRLEYARHDIIWYAIAIIPHPNHHIGTVVRHTNLDPLGMRQSSVFQKIEEHFEKIILAGLGNELAVRDDRKFHAALSPEAFQIDNIADHGADIGGLSWWPLLGRSPVTAKRAGNLVEPIDLGQDACRVLLQNLIVIFALVRMRALQVLDAESNGGQWVLDLVRDLTRHLSPREHALAGAEVGGHAAERGEDRNELGRWLAAEIRLARAGGCRQGGAAQRIDRSGELARREAAEP